MVLKIPFQAAYILKNRTCVRTLTVRREITGQRIQTEKWWGKDTSPSRISHMDNPSNKMVIEQNALGKKKKKEIIN